MFSDKLCCLLILNIKMSNMRFLELKWIAVGLDYGGIRVFIPVTSRSRMTAKNLDPEVGAVGKI